MAEPSTGWRRCSACKNPIDFETVYWNCSVSTCNRKRTTLVFCTVSCYEVHLPSANHRESWAVERRSPSEALARAESSGEAPSKRRRLVRPPGTESRPHQPDGDLPREVLIVASRLKEYVRARAGYNTSDGVLEPLSEILREVCDRAIENARAEGRKTVLDRDVPRR